MAATTPTRLTVDDLLRLGSDVWVEVVNGALVIGWPEGRVQGANHSMGPVGFLHGLIAGNVYDVIKPFVMVHKLGYVQGDGVIYVLAEDDTGVRTALVPDVSFVRKERVSPDLDLSRPFPGAPDLAVEVISPSDTAADMQVKVDAYLDAGTVQVWVLYPNREQVYLYARSENKTTVALYSGADRLDSDILFPGLSLTAAALFALPDLDE